MNEIIAVFAIMCFLITVAVIAKIKLNRILRKAEQDEKPVKTESKHQDIYNQLK
jgi:hypothetical protein